HHPVLERPGLRLVGVADEVMRMSRLPGDGLPLRAGRERGAAAAEQLRLGDLSLYFLLSDIERAAERGVAALAPVRVERRRIEAFGDAAQQPETRIALLRQRGRLRWNRLLARLRTRDGAQCRRRALAEAEARRRMRAGRHLDACELTGDVGTHVQHLRLARLEREQRIEARDA